MYVWSTQDREGPDRTSSGFLITVLAGVVHMLSREIALTTEISYEVDYYTYEEESASGNGSESQSGNRISIRVGLGLFLY